MIFYFSKDVVSIVFVLLMVSLETADELTISAFLILFFNFAVISFVFNVKELPVLTVVLSADCDADTFELVLLDSVEEPVGADG